MRPANRHPLTVAAVTAATVGPAPSCGTAFPIFRLAEDAACSD